MNQGIGPPCALCHVAPGTQHRFLEKSLALGPLGQGSLSFALPNCKTLGQSLPIQELHSSRNANLVGPT